MSEETPTDKQSTRDAVGRFLPGCAPGPGNPHARRVARIRAALFRAVTPADILVAVKALMKQAREGDRLALAELLDRTIGKAVASDVEERLARLEEAINGSGK